MLEAWVRLHSHHDFRLRRASLISFVTALIILVIVSTILVCKVCRPFVLMRTAIVLGSSYYLVDI